MIKFKQKKGWLLRDFVIAGVLFGLILGLYVLAIADTSNNYINIPGVNHDVVSPEFASHYAKLNDLLSKSDSMSSAVQGSGGLSIIGTFDIAFNSVFTVIAMIWQTILIYTGLGSWIPNDFTFISAAPMRMFISAVLACGTIYIVFVWLSSIMRGKI
jgi:hypothetical protein